MKKFISLFFVSLLFISCSSDNGEDENEDNYVVVNEPIEIWYSELKEGTDEYMYFEDTGWWPYQYNDVISYEIVEIVGDYDIIDSSKASKYSTIDKTTRLKMIYVFDLKVDEYNNLKNNVDLPKTFITFNLRLTLKEDYKKF